MGENPSEQINKTRSSAETSTLNMLYEESWKEYHHTEYMIFVFIAAVAAADVTLLGVGKDSAQVIPSLSIATILGLGSVLITWRQNQSREYRMKIISRLERRLYIDDLIGKEDRTAPRLGNTLLILSILLFIVPLFFLLTAFAFFLLTAFGPSC